MKTNNGIRIRRSVQELQNDYAKGDKKPLEDVMRAWKGIKELPPDNPKSFFRLAGFHGEPFRGAGWGSPNYQRLRAGDATWQNKRQRPKSVRL